MNGPEKGVTSNDPVAPAPSPGSAAGGTPQAEGGVLIAILVAIIYTATMAFAWLISSAQYSDTAVLVSQTWPVVAVLALVMVVILWRTGLRGQFRHQVLGLPLLLVVPVAVALIGALVTFVGPGVDWRLVAVVLLGTFFVGLGEEVAYRGIILNALATRTTTIWAVVWSSVLFGLMHAVNVFVQPAGDTVRQVVVTTLIGLLFGWVYVFSGGNLWLVVVLHWLYDFALIAPQATPSGENPFFPVGLAILVCAIVALVLGIRRFRGQAWQPERTVSR